MRHGETEGNARGIAQGKIDFPLNAEGKRQAKAIARRLSEIKFDSIYCSDLKRGYQTADEIAKRQHAKVIRSPLLQERTFGKLEGTPYGNLHKYRHNSFTRPPQGESIRDALERAKPFIKKILSKNKKGKTVLIVTHGTVGRATLCFLLGLPVGKARLFGGLKNTSITEVKFYPQGPRLMRLNDHAHLED